MNISFPQIPSTFPSWMVFRDSSKNRIQLTAFVQLLPSTSFFRSNVWLLWLRKIETLKHFYFYFFHSSLKSRKNTKQKKLFNSLLCRSECFYDFSHRDKHLISLFFISAFLRVGEMQLMSRVKGDKGWDYIKSFKEEYKKLDISSLEKIRWKIKAEWGWRMTKFTTWWV